MRSYTGSSMSLHEADLKAGCARNWAVLRYFRIYACCMFSLLAAIDLERPNDLSHDLYASKVKCGIATSLAQTHTPTHTRTHARTHAHSHTWQLQQ